MSRVRNSDTALEKLLCEELIRNGVTTYTRNNKTIFGKPDIAFIARKIAVFCDGDFWHGLLRPDCNRNEIFSRSNCAQVESVAIIIGAKRDGCPSSSNNISCSF